MADVLKLKVIYEGYFFQKTQENNYQLKILQKL